MKKIVTIMLSILLLIGFAINNQASAQMRAQNGAKEGICSECKTKQLLSAEGAGKGMCFKCFMQKNKTNDDKNIPKNKEPISKKADVEKTNPNGPYKLTYKNGQTMEEGTMLNNKPNGLLKQYYENGKPKYIANYVNGNVEGKVTEYFESGKINKEFTYSNNKVIGPYIEYFENGNKLTEVTFVDGKKSGNETVYFENGQVAKKATYKDDVMDGNAESFYSNGKLCAKMKFANGVKIENATTYNYTHSQKTEVTYVNGEDDMKGKGYLCANENCSLENDFIGREQMMKTIYLPFCPKAQVDIKLNTMRAGMMAGIASTEKAEITIAIDFRRFFEADGKDTYVSLLKIYTNNKWGNLKITFTMDDGGLREYKYKINPDEKDKNQFYVVFEEEVESIIYDFIEGNYTGLTVTVNNEDASGKKSSTNYTIDSTKDNLNKIKEALVKLKK